MANFDFYKAKVIELKQRLEWIKSSLEYRKSIHQELRLWIQEKCEAFESKISQIYKLTKIENPSYLSLIKKDHLLLENNFLSICEYTGILLREGVYEYSFSKLIKRICHESGLSVKDFLVTFGNGPAVRGHEYPIFYTRDEALSSPFSWIAFYHEIGHIIIRNNRQQIIESLIDDVRSHYADKRIEIGPIDMISRQKQEQTIDEAERYWSDIRLEELFCDCFATYICGFAFIYFWLDYGISFEEYPKCIRDYDEHPPFFARLEACWRILPNNLKQSDFGRLLERTREDYSKSSFNTTNPNLEYRTVCNKDLIHRVADKSVHLIQKYCPSLNQWNHVPNSIPLNIDNYYSLTSILNDLVALLQQGSDNYLGFEKIVIKSVLES